MEKSPLLHTVPPPYHKYALDLLTEGFQQYSIKPTKLGQATSNQIYAKYTKHHTSGKQSIQAFP